MPPVMVMACSRPVPRVLGVDRTRSRWRRMSKLTSIWGMPIGAGGIPVSRNLPRLLLSPDMARSPLENVDLDLPAGCDRRW